MYGAHVRIYPVSDFLIKNLIAVNAKKGDNPCSAWVSATVWQEHPSCFAEKMKGRFGICF
jgi:hypothetical protein